jgi:hypothetical protein
MPTGGVTPKEAQRVRHLLPRLVLEHTRVFMLVLAQEAQQQREELKDDQGLEETADEFKVDDVFKVAEGEP